MDPKVLGEARCSKNFSFVQWWDNNRPCHRPCLLIHPPLHFPYLPSSPGWRGKAAEAAQAMFTQTAKSSWVSLVLCWGGGGWPLLHCWTHTLHWHHARFTPLPARPPHILPTSALGQNTLAFWLLFPLSLWDHLLRFIYDSSWLFKFKILLHMWGLYTKIIMSPWMWECWDIK